MTFGAAQTSAGKIYRYFDIKWSFLISMLIFEIGSLICGVASNSKTLVVGRAIAGLGKSSFPTRLVPERRRERPPGVGAPPPAFTSEIFDHADIDSDVSSGGAGMSVGGTSIISFTVPPAKKPIMFGIIGATYAVAAV
jgi:MFS transporter, DHA2 family, glioxin efflux transporter